MLKKLRLRFVGINMAIVLVILCTIFGVLLHTTHANLERESVDMITAVAADPLQLNWPDTASRLPYFTVRISPYGSVRVSGTSYYDLSDEQVLSGIVTAALRSGGEQGLLHDYSLRYLRTTWRGNEYIIFADVSSANATMLAKLYSHRAMRRGGISRRQLSSGALGGKAGGKGMDAAEAIRFRRFARAENAAYRDPHECGNAP